MNRDKNSLKKGRGEEWRKDNERQKKNYSYLNFFRLSSKTEMWKNSFQLKINFY